MNNKPLTYDSLKTVIQYLDPNTRFLLYSRAPSIRTAERAVPLIIERLWIQVHQILVNNISYECGVYQVDCKDGIPYLVSGSGCLNLKLTCNVDEFGTRDYISAAGGMLPGNDGSFNWNLFGMFDREIIPTNEGRLQKLEEILEIERQRFDQLINYRPKEIPMNKKDEVTNMFTFKFIRTNPHRIYNEEELGILKNEKLVKKAVKYIQDRIRQMENELILFQNKSKNVRPKFEIYLTINHENDLPHLTERVNYTGDLHKAEESLRDFMFSKRRHVVRVNSFKMDQPCQVRMPTDLKMRVKNLNFMTRMSPGLEILKPIIDESSFPLETLQIHIKPENVEKLDYEFIGNSKLLVCTFSMIEEFPIIQNLRNQIVHFPWCSKRFLESEGFYVMIRSWIESKKPVGTCFTFFLSDSAIQILDSVKDRFEDASVGNECVNIPMSASAVLKIRYFRNASSHLFIRMAVVPVN
uniref:F-box domain-containing protein n=1 Tax=Caenorhabditis tropicalis TaxID=1561998 RepID=A0A1I7TAI3_9PELO